MTRTLFAFAVLAATATTAVAQAPVAVDASPRGQVELTVFARGANNRNAAVGKLHIDYGQPSARGRAVAGNLIPAGQVWRLGANAATSFITDVDIMIGEARIPKGEYTLYSIQTASGAQLIVNKQTKQWGTTYEQAQDLVRIPLKVTTLQQPIETFAIWLIPDQQPSVKGELRMAWGTVQYSVAWSVAP
jgi:hypothetical protein